MNAARRKEISKISAQIEELTSQLEALQETEQECYDNMPEPLQDSERGETMQNAIDSMESALDNLRDAVDNLSEIIG